MAEFTEEQVTTQLKKMLQTTQPGESIDLVSAEAMHLLEHTVINISLAGVSEMADKLPVEAGQAVMLAIATLAFGLGVECGIELQTSDEFTKKFGDHSG